MNGTVVGAFPFSEYDESRVEMKSGDLLVCFTDGITEPENEYGEMFGEDRLVGTGRAQRASHGRADCRAGAVERPRLDRVGGAAGRHDDAAGAAGCKVILKVAASSHGFVYRSLWSRLA